MSSHSQLPTLQGVGMQLRQLMPADDAALLRIFGNANVVRFMGIPLLKDLSDAAALRERIWESTSARTLFQWGVARESDEVLLGTCTLSSISWSNERAEIGFALGQEHWGQGWMGKAAPLLLKHAFEDLGMYRIEADADPRNEPSMRLLTKLGFEREGFLRGRHLIAGERQDTVMYGLVKPSWLRALSGP